MAPNDTTAKVDVETPTPSANDGDSAASRNASADDIHNVGDFVNSVNIPSADAEESTGAETVAVEMISTGDNEPKTVVSDQREKLKEEILTDAAAPRADAKEQINQTLLKLHASASTATTNTIATPALETKEVTNQGNNTIAIVPDPDRNPADDGGEYLSGKAERKEAEENDRYHEAQDDRDSIVSLESMDRSLTSHQSKESNADNSSVDTETAVEKRLKQPLVENSAATEFFLYAKLCAHFLTCCILFEELDDFQLAELAKKEEEARIQALVAAGEIDRHGQKRKKSKPRKKLTAKQKRALRKAGVNVGDESTEGSDHLQEEEEDDELNEATPSGQRRTLMRIRETTEAKDHHILNWNDDWDFHEWQSIVWTPFKTEKQLRRALVVELDLCCMYLNIDIEDIRALLGPQLEVLKIGWNQGLTGDIKYFKNCEALKHLNIHATSLVGNIEVFQSCPRLEVLGLGMCMVEGDLNESFEMLQVMKILYLEHTKVIGDPKALNAARKRKKPFPYTHIEIHGYVHNWWEETDEDRRRRAVRTYRAGFASDEEYMMGEKAGFKFKVGYDALIKTGFKTKKEYDEACLAAGYALEVPRMSPERQEMRERKKLAGGSIENDPPPCYDNHGVPIIMDLLLRKQQEAEKEKLEAAKRALMFEDSSGAESHTPREEMKMIDIHAQFAT